MRGGALFVGPILPAVKEAAQESFGAGVGLLLLAYYRHTGQARLHPQPVVISCNNGWVLATAAFIATLGRGFVLGSPA